MDNYMYVVCSALFLAGLLLGILLRSLFKGVPRDASGDGFGEIVPAGDDEDHRTPSFSLLLNQLLAIFRHGLGAEGLVYLRRRENGFEPVAASAGTDINTSLIPLSDGLFGLVASEEKEVMAEMVQPQALRHLKDARDPYSVLFYPVMRRGEVFGVIAAHRPVPNPFTDRDVLSAKRAARLLDELEIFAGRARKLEYSRVRWERTEHGIRAMLKETEPTEMAGAAVKTLAEILPARYAFIVLQSGVHNYGALVTHGFPPPQELDDFEPNSWSYWLMTNPEESVFISRSLGNETRMPVLFAREKFPDDKMVLLQKLSSGEHTLGIAGMIGSEKEPFTEEDKASAQLFLKEASALVELALMNAAQKELAIRDGLTGLFNRRYFNERFHQEFTRSERGSEPLSLIMADVDHFKKINDGYGHPAGDAVLREVARRIEENVREMDVLCRYGGEEFAAILPGARLQDAFDIAERVRKAVQEKAVPLAGGKIQLNVNVSLGVSSYPESAPAEKHLLSTADAALYEAKKSGRNKVVTAKKK